MQLFHTSPTKITKIDRNGRFSEFLFFSSDVYCMTADEEVSVYSIELDASSVIEASSIFYHDDSDEKLDALVATVAKRYAVEEAVARDLIDETASIYEVDSSVEAEDLADASWDIQLATAKAAKMLGFQGVRVTDEQGAAYMIDMLGREEELIEVDA